MQPYQHDPLQTYNSIRVLVLHPSADSSDAITCTLQHVRLSDVAAAISAEAGLTYEALSYVWGNQEHRQTIYLQNNERVLYVGENCYSALQHLRHTHDDRRLWVDAICIDQENLEERADQVRIMDIIYREASGVVVYLGEHTAGSQIVFNDLVESDRMMARGGAYWDRPPPSDSVVRALETLFERPWFKRIWVLQETYMNGSVTFICGSTSASYQVLFDLTYGYRDRTRVTRTVPPYAIEIKRREYLEKTFLTEQHSLWYLLRETRTHRATDPRDNIFALRSLMYVQQPAFDALIRYVATVEDIFIDTTMFLMPVLGLHILTAARHPHAKNMPSWIPDWSQNLPLRKLFSGYHFEPVIQQGNFRVQPSESKEANQSIELITMGCRYAQVVQKSRVFSFADLEDAEAQMKDLYLSFDFLREFLGANGTHDNTAIHTQLGQDILEAISLIKGEELHEYLAGGGVYENANSKLTIITEKKRIVAQSVWNFFVGLEQCRIVLLDNKKLAIVAGSVQIGDVVCILSGSSSPCALRSDSNGNWELACGDCEIFSDECGYSVHAWAFCPEKYLAQYQGELEEFRIR